MSLLGFHAYYTQRDSKRHTKQIEYLWSILHFISSYAIKIFTSSAFACEEIEDILYMQN